jgi:hypothetical protein
MTGMVSSKAAFKLQRAAVLADVIAIVTFPKNNKYLCLKG